MKNCAPSNTKLSNDFPNITYMYVYIVCIGQLKTGDYTYTSIPRCKASKNTTKLYSLALTTFAIFWTLWQRKCQCIVYIQILDNCTSKHQYKWQYIAHSGMCQLWQLGALTSAQPYQRQTKWVEILQVSGCSAALEWRKTSKSSLLISLV